MWQLLLYFACPHWPPLAHPSVFLPTLAACVMLFCFKLAAQLFFAPTARVLLNKLALLFLVCRLR